MNIFAKYKELISSICSELYGFDESDLNNIVAEPPKEAKHGDIATNAAMVLVKKLGKSPKQIAEEIKSKLEVLADVNKVEIAGPGFINITLNNSVWVEFLIELNKNPETFGDNNVGNGEKINVEYVSANPTGPMHVGHARNTVLGDVTANLLEKSGFDVTREYYINDAGVQIGVLCDSVLIRYKQALGQDIAEIPEGLYPGEYLIPIGKKIAKKYGKEFENSDSFNDEIRQFIIDQMMVLIKADLADMGVKHDVFSSEKKLHDDKAIEKSIDHLESLGLLYRGVLEPPKGKQLDDWEPREQLLFRSTDFGDDVDRALQKSNGEYTYFASDIAYHKYKYDRGFNKMAITLGADHGGYFKRLKAVVKAISSNKAEIEILPYQLVNLMENGEPIKMSKRSGNFITLRDVLDAVGKDVLRFIMLTRKSDAGIDFDLKKVLEATKENPVFYVQYACARISSVGRQLDEKNITLTHSPDLTLLKHEAELSLIKKIAEYPRVVESAALSFEPHKITFYLYDLASHLHQLWNLGKDEGLKFIDESDLEVSAARVYLINSCKIVLKSGLELLGVEPVEKM